MKKNQKQEKKNEPTIAAGSREVLEAKASKEDVKEGNYTKVTHLSNDEVDPS